MAPGCAACALRNGDGRVLPCGRGNTAADGCPGSLSHHPPCIRSYLQLMGAGYLSHRPELARLAASLGATLRLPGALRCGLAWCGCRARVCTAHVDGLARPDAARSALQTGKVWRRLRGRSVAHRSCLAALLQRRPRTTPCCCSIAPCRCPLKPQTACTEQRWRPAFCWRHARLACRSAACPNR